MTLWQHQSPAETYIKTNERQHFVVVHSFGHPAAIFPPTHLVHLVPLGVDGLVDDFALEELRPHLDDSIRVWLSLNQPAQEFVFTQQFLGLQEVDPQDPLMGERQREMVMMKDQVGTENIFHIYCPEQ